MQCAAFEDLLSSYDELTTAERLAVDAHLAVCVHCHEYLEAFAELDRELSEIYEGLRPHPGFATKVAWATASSQPVPRPRRPSVWPEVLDFCGWAAVVAIASVLAIAAAARAGITLALPH
jgi:anti-sigma factor RsiW